MKPLPFLCGSLKVERFVLAVPDLPPPLVGTKLVQLSDFHYDGLRLSEALLERAIEASNQEAPDLVLLTGDYITDDPSPIQALSRRLQSLQSRAGIYACLGNHDLYWRNARDRIVGALTRAGIQVLWNEAVAPLGPQLPLVGLADFWSREFDPEPVLSQLDPALPRLILCHNPDAAKVLQRWRVDLQLSGHTHGGQVVLPGLGPAPRVVHQLGSWIPFLRGCSRVMEHWQWAQGWHQVGSNGLYVNRGLGTYFPGRVFCPPEVTAITLSRFPLGKAIEAGDSVKDQLFASEADAIDPQLGAIQGKLIQVQQVIDVGN